jgi:hypothetical protein
MMALTCGAVRVDADAIKGTENPANNVIPIKNFFMAIYVS